MSTPAAAGMVAAPSAEAPTCTPIARSAYTGPSRSVVVASQAAIPSLLESKGFIINTTSVAARHGGGGGAGMYASAKAFVSNLTRGMAKEFATKGLRVNAVAPGIALTPFHDRYSTEAQLKAMVATIPMGRASTSEENVGAYLFLASTTLSGYTAYTEPKPTQPDLALVEALSRRLAVPIIAEGRFNTPELARSAINAGAHAVVVRTMITNAREITRSFAAALSEQ